MIEVIAVLKKFLVGALMAVVLMSFGAFTEATDVERENICCGGYCAQNCDEQSGEYCDRYGCRRGR